VPDKNLPMPAFDKWNVHVVGGDTLVENMFKHKGCNISRSEFGSNVVVFTGGADVTPLLYGEKMHISTRCNLRRDIEEVSIFKHLHPGVPKLGICRGGQLLNVMCGGTMWQDVDGHTTSHPALSRITGEITTVTSTHHQMMRAHPYKGYEFLVAQQSTWKAGPNYTWRPETPQKGTDDWDDVEGVYYKEWNAMCFQPHPEYANAPSTAELFFECIYELIDWSHFWAQQTLAGKKEKAA
jgi:Predicted glutamine amidotransferases